MRSLEVWTVRLPLSFCPTLNHHHSLQSVFCRLVLQHILTSPSLSPALLSVSSRLLLSLLLTLPQYPAPMISTDLTLQGRITERVVRLCEETILADANNPWLQRGLGIFSRVLAGGSGDGYSEVGLILTHSGVKPNYLTLNAHRPKTLSPSSFIQNSRHSRAHQRISSLYRSCVEREKKNVKHARRWGSSHLIVLILLRRGVCLHALSLKKNL